MADNARLWMSYWPVAVQEIHEVQRLVAQQSQAGSHMCEAGSQR